ncbi:MAG: tetratricopeptide repeat protein [Armatimonadota bacterium]|nr:tetratricopeptide repeat protein [Armatimonadota bacterium]MCX7776871.1 tetratricopeptide repeat protein [Armatimonadota bacterium]MDW8024443.1 tetratricopeptide repeat protein [Armatimonadota bacterium]
MFWLIRMFIRLIMWLISHIVSVAIAIFLIALVAFIVARTTPLDEFYRARACAKVGDYENAEHWYRKGLEAHPNSRYAPQARYELGLLLFEQKRYNEALVQFQAALDRLTDGQKRAKALVSIGDCYANMKKWEKAASSYMRALKEHHFDEALSATALLRAGRCYESAGNLSAAGNAYRKAFQEHPTAPDAPKALLSYADLLYKLGKHDRAIEHYKLLIRRYSDSDEAVIARLRLARAYEAQRNYKNAISTLLDFLRHAPRLARTAAYRQLMEGAKAQLKRLRGGK